MTSMLVTPVERRREAVGEGLSDGVGRRGGGDGDEGVGADRGLQRLGRVEGQHPAVVDDGQPVAELVGLLHVVRGEEDGLAVVVELLEDLPQGDAALGVEAGGGLVEEEDRGPVHHRPGDHQALGHAAGEGEHRGLRPLLEAELLEQPVALAAGDLRRHAEEAAVEVEVLPDGEGPVEGVALGHDADELLGRGRVGDHVDAADEGTAAGGEHPGGEHAGGGALAGAVGAEEPEDLTLEHLEVEAVDRLHPARVDLGEALGADHDLTGGGRGRRIRAPARRRW